jgi:molybdenum cofactor biosynthesis enzyme
MTEASKMVEVGAKEVTAREATSECTIHMTPQACAELVKGTQRPHRGGDGVAHRGRRSGAESLRHCQGVRSRC